MKIQVGDRVSVSYGRDPLSNLTCTVTRVDAKDFDSVNRVWGYWTRGAGEPSMHESWSGMEDCVLADSTFDLDPIS